MFFMHDDFSNAFISVFADALIGAFLMIIVIIVALPLALLPLVQMRANRTVKAIVAFHTHLQQSQEENTVYAHESIRIVTLEIEKIYYLINKLIDMKRVLLLLRDTKSLQIFSESLQQTLLFMHDDMTRLRFQLIANIENQMKTLHAAHDDIDSLRDINLLRDVDVRLSHQIREFEALKVRVL